MRNLLVILIVTVGCLLSCKHPTDTVLPDFSERVYTPRYASGFTIDKVEGSQCFQLTVLSPWQGADSVTSRLIIDPECLVPQGNTLIPVIRNYARRIVVTSSSHIAMLQELDAVDRIVGVSGLQFVSNQELLGRADKPVDIGYDGNYNYEALVSCKPDLVLLYGIDGASQLEPRLIEMGIPYVYIGDYIEESPLGKCEWIKALAYVTGLDSKAEDTFEPIVTRYDSLKSLVANVTTKPTVMLNTPYRDIWFMPSQGSYMVTLIEDAGGQYIYTENESSVTRPIDYEKAWLLTREADMWLNTGRCTTLEELTEQWPRLASAPCVVNGNVYNNTRRITPGGGNDFFESGIMHPDLILQDLIKIFHPYVVGDSIHLTYYKKLQ